MGKKISVLSACRPKKMWEYVFTFFPPWAEHDTKSIFIQIIASLNSEFSFS